jgi:hypothetical protein
MTDTGAIVRRVLVDGAVKASQRGPRSAAVNSVSVTALDENPGNDSGAFAILPTAAPMRRERRSADQPCRGDLSDLRGLDSDRSGPPAAVGVLDGGSLAGKDSSNSSSSLSSGFDCILLGGDFLGSFIAASPWSSPCSLLKLRRPRKVPS